MFTNAHIDDAPALSTVELSDAEQSELPDDIETAEKEFLEPDNAPTDFSDVTREEELAPVVAFAIHDGVFPLTLPRLREACNAKADGDKTSSLGRSGYRGPQLANALQGRFGLSLEPARALVELIAKPPWRHHCSCEGQG